MIKSNVIKNKPKFIDGLIKLNSFLMKKKFEKENIEHIIHKYNIDESIIKKFFSYISHVPNLLIFFNRYLNIIGKKIRLIDFLHSYRHILFLNNLLDTRKLFFFKNSEFKNSLQQQIINLLDQYFQTQFQIYFNYQELLYYYNLFCYGRISHKQLCEIDILINGETTIDIKNIPSPKKEKENISVKEIIEVQDPTPIAFEISNEKIQQCKSCSFFSRKIVLPDAHLNSTTGRKITFINLYPSNIDQRYGKIFSKSDHPIRYFIEQNLKNDQWFLLNLIPCSIKSKSELGKTEKDVNDQVMKCWSVVKKNIHNFNPDLIIFIGQTVFDHYPDIKLNDSPKNISFGEIILNKYIIMPDPAGMKSPIAQKKCVEEWNKLNQIIQDFYNQKNNSSITLDEKVDTKKLKNDNQSKLTTLLDIRELKTGDILMVFIDENGKKIYKTEKNKTVGFLKRSNYDKCPILTNEVHQQFSMTKDQKFKLTKMLRDKMNKLKEI